MGLAMELLTGNATAPSTTFTALTMATGNSLTIRSADVRSQISLLSLWAYNNGAGTFRVRSPRLHDNQQGIRVEVKATTPAPRYPRWGFLQSLIPQDVLVAEITGSATSGKIEMGSILVYYSDLPGINGRFITPDQLTRWGVNMMGQKVAVTAGSAGGYSGSVAINAGSGLDNWKANTDYALVGYEVDTDCCAVRIQGADVGNLGLGGPGWSSNPARTADWFAALSAYYNLAAIPVFNAANKNAILVDVAQNDGGSAVNVTFYLVELKPTSMRQ